MKNEDKQQSMYNNKLTAIELTIKINNQREQRMNMLKWQMKNMLKCFSVLVKLYQVYRNFCHI